MDKEPQTKKCPRCGGQFLCYSETNQRCWCADYTLAERVLKFLAKEYNGCLCPKCIAEFDRQE